MSRRLNDLLSERATAWSATQEITERGERDGWTAELEAQRESALDDVERLSRSIEQEERAQRLSGLDLRDAETAEQEDRSFGGDLGDDERYVRAFDAWLRGGREAVRAEDREIFQRGFTAGDEMRAQGIATGSAGGFTVPEGFWAKVTDRMLAYGGIMGISNVLDTESGIAIPWPSADDTGNVGALLSENTQATEQDVTFGTNSLNAYTYTSKIIRVSLQFLQDNGVNGEQYLVKKLGERIGRAVAAHLATGTGTAQPQGVAGSAGFATGKTGLAGQTTSVIYDDLVDLQHSVDVAYRASGRGTFVMNDLTLRQIRKIKDSQGLPIWQPSIQAGAPDALLGSPIVVDNGMPVMAANAKSIAFGDFESGVVVRRVRGGQLLRLEERYADLLQVGFIGFGRYDARIDDAAAVRLYVNSAT